MRGPLLLPSLLLWWLSLEGGPAYCWGFVIPYSLSFGTLPQQSRFHDYHGPTLIRIGNQRMLSSVLNMAASGNNNNNNNNNSIDPFQVLGMKEPTTDKKVIKRAYKHMALKFHPDVATTQDSTPLEKKAASDQFAKINWAYETLMGKRQGDTTYGKSTTTTTASTNTSSGSSTGWTPPHRRSGAYSSTDTSSSSTGSTGSGDWRDFMPKYEESDYDTDGDSFGAIFSDLFSGVVAGSSNNVFKDFVEFLEQNMGGEGGGSMYDDDDAELRALLQTGSVQDIGNEMEDTELVVTQLQQKLSRLKDEILMATTEAKVTARYLDQMKLEESLAELQAREKVVQGYLNKGQKRLLALQTRYKALITYGGQDDVYARTGRRETGTAPSGTGSNNNNDNNSNRGGDAGSSSSSYRSTSDSARSSSSSSSSSGSSRRTSTTASGEAEDDQEAWQTEGFGSSSYGRGSSRRRRSRGPTTNTDSSSSSRPTSNTSSYSSNSNSNPQPPPRQEPSWGSSSESSSTRTTPSPEPPSTSVSSSGGTTTSSSSSSSSSSTVPPHRRTSNYDRTMADDKKRLRELKVQEEFDKLKKEMGY
jgi:hypothetical protein